MTLGSCFPSAGRSRSRIAAATLGAVLASVVLSAGQPPAQPPAPEPTLAIGVERSNETATLTYFNRPIVVLRARVMGRPPAERAALAVRALDNLTASGRRGPFEAQATGGGVLIGIGTQTVVGLTTADIDEIAGETLDGVASQTVRLMQQAVDEAVAARRPGVWLRAVALSLVALAAATLLLWALGRARRLMLDKLSAATAQAVARAGLADQPAVRATQLVRLFLRRVVAVVIALLRFFVAYTVVTFILQRFPYARPWGESLRGYLVNAVGDVSFGILRAIPSLVTIFIIAVITRAVITLLALWFDAVERGVVTVPWMHPETVPTTRRLMKIALWLFAAALAYPYVPGSNTDAFKGISVFVGLLLTLGSSGFVNQLMSGIMVTYSRALRVGDFVRIGDVEGTIEELGTLAVKIRTLRSEEVTIPYALVVSQTITDYSRFEESVLTTTAATIGYDAPWRQVHELLLRAAERTPGIRRDPAPRVLQTALEDAAVRYTLLFCLKRQESRAITLGQLHGHIQDLFNEYGVQIMTPRYEADPTEPKLVPKDEWFAAPARPDSLAEVQDGRAPVTQASGRGTT